MVDVPADDAALAEFVGRTGGDERNPRARTGRLRPREPTDPPPESPDERGRRRAICRNRPKPAARLRRAAADLGISERVLEWCVKRVVIGTYNDGFIHAGNLAYLSAASRSFPSSSSPPRSRGWSGARDDGLQRGRRVPARPCRPMSRDVLRQPIHDVLDGAIGLAAVARRARRAVDDRRLHRDDARHPAPGLWHRSRRTPFWRYRLGAIGMIIASVILAMVAFSFQVILTGVEQFVYRVLPLRPMRSAGSCSVAARARRSRCSGRSTSCSIR